MSDFREIDIINSATIFDGGRLAKAMNVSLTSKVEAFVRELAALGLYNNSSEFVREALRLLHEQVGKRTPPETAAIRKAIARIEGGLRAKGVTALHLFGSVVRGEATAGSDVDVLIEIDPKLAFTLLDQAGIQDDLADAIGHPVDVVLKASLRKELRRTVLKEAVRVF